MSSIQTPAMQIQSAIVPFVIVFVVVVAAETGPGTKAAPILTLS